MDTKRLMADGLTRSTLTATTALAMIMFATNAYAQDDTDTAVPASVETDPNAEDVDEVVATGIRQALQAARDLKRDADTAVDSITASDVSTLPDLSVAEALARIPGVVVQRIQLGDSAGDFPSPEGGGNLIRGLTLVRSELNGRESFSANGGRALDFGTIPPELIGAVDVYKNSTADLTEGGIGGTINLRTLEPFDRPGRIAVATLDGTYTDLRNEWSPDFSILLGDRWGTSAGEFGLLGSFSSSELKSDLNGFQVGPLLPLPVANNRIAVPGGFQLRTNEVDRERDSYYLAGQYENNDGSFRATAKYALIENKVDSDERTLEWFPDGESWTAGDADGDGTNDFLTGESLTGIVGDFTSVPFGANLPACNGSNDPNLALSLCETRFPVSGLYTGGVISNSLRDWTGAAGANFTNLAIHQTDESKTDDLSLNIKWRPADQWFVNLDAHYTTAEFTRERLWGGTRFLSDFTVNPDLDNPEITLVPDPASMPNVRAGSPSANPTDLSDPTNAFLLFAADEFQDNEGDMYAFRGDVEYEFDNDGWFDAIKFGARYADRTQTNRSAGLNWAGVAPPWAGDGYLPYSEIESIQPDVVDFSDFFRGGVVQGANSQVLFTPSALLQDYDAFVAAVFGDDDIIRPAGTRGPDDPGVTPDWNPLRVNGVVDYAGRGTESDITEKTINLYGRLDFGKEFSNGTSLDANVGLRFIRTELDSVGLQTYRPIEDNPTSAVDDMGNPIDGPSPSDFSPEAVAYSMQPNTPEGFSSSDERWLPSLNIKWNLNDESLIRFGISKAITRPNLSDLRAQRELSTSLRFVRDEDATPTMPLPPVDITPTQINASGGNPLLEPITSVNMDLSYEWYFGDENSFTFALFNKEIKNNIIFASQTQGTVNLDGIEVPIVYNGNLNQDDATVRGFEVAYQQFYDFLPGLLSNLGLQANYTYIDASTNPPPGSVDADGDGAPDDFGRIYRYGLENFLGLSDHAANVIGIYQDDKLELRLAYNWRSEYLSSYRDFVTGNPIFQEDRGYLDGSMKYDFTDNLQFRLQVANILDTKAKSTQVIDESRTRFARTSFIGDRRIKVGLRYQF